MALAGTGWHWLAGTAGTLADTVTSGTMGSGSEIRLRDQEHGNEAHRQSRHSGTASAPSDQRSRALILAVRQRH